MACAQQSAIQYLKSARRKLVIGMRNLPLIVENLYQRKVFSEHEVDALKAERTEFDKARSIMDWVVNKGEEASYELLSILDATQKRTLSPELHSWITCFPVRSEDVDTTYVFVDTKPCQNYQAQLRKKAKSILKDQRQSCRKYLEKAQVSFQFIPLVLETDSEEKAPQRKIQSKIQKCKKLRNKKLRAYIPKEEHSLSPLDLLRGQDKKILLIGKPGIGKTTVVQEMLRLWAEKSGKGLDYMFYFSESSLSHSSNIGSLESVLFDVYLKPMEKDRKEVFKDIEENSENVVIAFDGVTDLEENSILWKIMHQELLPDAKIVITCRSEVEDDPLFSDWPTQKVYVQGFSDKSIQAYYQKMLGSNSDLLNIILKNQELLSLSHVPMYAFIAAAITPFKQNKGKNSLHTVTYMYIHIFRLAVERHGKRKYYQTDKYLGEIKDQIQPLMEKAYNATMQKNLNLINCDETDICHAFLKIITTRDSATSGKTYCAFLHNTMQEFFSALWLLENPENIENVLQLSQTKEHKHMRHVLPFLCGLLSEHNTKLLKSLFPEDQMKKTHDWFIEKFLNSFFGASESQSHSEQFDLLYMCQCLYELQSPKACLMFLEKMNHQIEPEVDLDPHQHCALAYIIAQSRDKEVYVKLENCDIMDTGMDMMLSCSPNIRLKLHEEPLKQIAILLEFFHKASQCCCTFSCVRNENNCDICKALLDLCSHVKNYETQTGRRFLPALQLVFQTPDVWIIDLSERKTSLLLEVLKLQTEKKPVELRGCSEEESEVRSFLQCLPFISQLRIDCWSSSHVVQFLLRLFMKAAEIKTEQMLKQLSSVCTYSSFPYQLTDRIKQSDFLLDLYSHVKNYKTKTGRSFLPALQSVFQSPDVWIIDLSERKTSVLLEVLKLQTEKKPVELREFSDEESELRSFLQCLPFISQLRFSKWRENDHCICLLRLFIKAAEVETQTGKHMLKLLSSVCTYRSFPHEKSDKIKQSNFLLGLCSHVKNYETQIRRSILPALQSVFQTPDVWIIDLSERKTSVLLEVLKLQTKKKPVELRGCSEKKCEVRRFLKCLPFISQLRFWHTGDKEKRFLMNLISAAVHNDTDTGTSFLNLLLSVCSYKNFPFNEECNDCNQTNFLLDLCSYVKNYETQTGRSFLPALQSVFQIPDVWIIDLSQRKSSILLEVLKLQREKKPVELRGFSEEESEVRSFLQCLRFISQLIFSNQSENDRSRFLVSLFIKAAEFETQSGEQMPKLLSSVCIYTSFPYEKTDITKQTDFLLDLYSHVKNYETQTSRSLLPALQSVFQFPDVWIIDLSKRKTSVLMEVLNLQANKKPLELRRCSEKKSKVRRLLQCLPFISQLRFSKPSKSVQSKFLLRLFINAAETETQTGEQMLKLLSSVCTYSSFPYEKTDRIKQSDFLLDLYSHVKNYETQTSRSFLPALQSVFQSPDVWIIDLSDKKTSVLLEVLKLQTKKKPVELRGFSEEESEVRSFLQCLPFISQLRPSERALQKLLEHIFEFQNEKSTQHFLQRLNGDLTSCSLTWEELRYFLQHRIKKITVDLRKSNIQCKMREILPLLNRIKLKGMSSSFMLSVIREIYESRSAGFVFSLLSSVGNCINLQSRDLDSVDCAALRFTLQHCTAASLNLMWTFIPEEELETFLPLLKHISHLSVDRLLLLKMLHCYSVSDVQQGSVFLLSALQHKLDFSCCSALDLTTNTDSEPLQLTADDCRVISRVIQRANTDRKTQLILKDCEINTAGMDQLFTVLHSVKLCCAKPLLLQFLAHVRRWQAESLSAALGKELDLSQTPLDLQACRGLALILEYSEGLTELDLSQCHLTDHSLDLLLPNLHKAQNIDFSGNYITDLGAQKIHRVVSHNSNVKTVRLFNNRIESKELFKAPQFEIW
nr:uncharacterized protein LOC101884073 [Danio rerio]|eukprot:XP_005164409.1 uncharacterized protein LOC101884073 [Danio rerio]